MASDIVPYNKFCRNKHTQPVPLFSAYIDAPAKIKIGYYCVFCLNFIPEPNPEIEICKNFIKNVAKIYNLKTD